MRTTASLLLLATLAAPSAHAASTAPDAERVAAQRALHTAVSSGTAKDILQVRARFAALSAAEPRSATLHYWVALADWRAVPRLSGRTPEEAERYCTDGLAEIDKALKLAPKDGETLALRSSLMGMSIQFHPSSMMTVGPELETVIKQALEVAPENPRVRLLAAINTLNKPAFVGGGADRALPVFARSQELFAAQAEKDTTGRDWGRDDSFIWAGRAASKLGDHAAARDYYRKALAVTPDHAWVRDQLLPEAEKALASAPATH